MTAEYEITKDDLRAFNLYHHRHSPTARQHYLRSWFVPAFVWLFVCIGIWYLADRERGTPLRTFLDLLPLFSGVPLYLVYFPWAYRRKLRKIVDGMVGEGQNRRPSPRVFGTLIGELSNDTGELVPNSLRTPLELLCWQFCWQFFTLFLMLKTASSDVTDAGA